MTGVEDDVGIPLGAFDLVRPFDKGGMGAIWSGWHRRTGVPIACKVLMEARAREPERQALFAREAQAIARLRHPGIVTVLDYGFLTAATEAASEGKLVAGSPFLVMELAPGGSLAKAPRPVSWKQFATVTYALLDALAYAHARDVVHRDIKPANILLGVANRSTGQHRVKLADFGIARSPQYDGEAGQGRITGSPGYMAPEQIQGDPRGYGPWTDLYSLGCVLFELASGKRPFDAPTPTELMIQHLTAAPREFQSRIPVPGGFQRWLLTLLGRHPLDRFQCAADAAHVLRRLGRPPGRAIRPPGAGLDVAPMLGTLTMLASSVFDSEGGMVTPMSTASAPLIGATEPAIDRPSTAEPGPAVAAPLAAVPPFRHEWREGPRQRPDMGLGDAGLGVFGLRDPGLVGRLEERAAVWRILGEVHSEAEVRAVIVRAPSGHGASQLARWVCRRSVELGVAVTVRGTHSPERAGESHEDGLGAMLARHYRVVGLGRGGIVEHLRAWGYVSDDASGDAYTLNALVELLHAGADDTAGFQLSSGAERHAAAVRALGAIAQHRPCVAWLDDVQRSDDAVALLRYALVHPPEKGAGLLFLLTVDDSELADRPNWGKALNKLVRHPAVTELMLGPLSPTATAELVDELLPLHPQLRERVVEHTGGDPRFTVELLTEWVERGLLTPSERGYSLAGEAPWLPSDVEARGRERLRAALGEAGRLEANTIALELAAALGATFDTDAWFQLCDAAGVVPRPQLVEGWIRRQLLEPTAEGMAFGNEGVRRVVAEGARNAGRWAGHHRRCVTLLQQGGGPLDRERMARHLVAAEAHEEAVQPLLDAAAARVRNGDYLQALGLVTRAEEALQSAADPDDGPTWRAWIACLRARIYRAQRQLQDAWLHAEKGETLARACEADRWSGEALFEKSYVAIERAEVADGARFAVASFEAFERAGHVPGVAKALLIRGRAELSTGRVDAAERLAIRGAEVFESLGEKRMATNALFLRGMVARWRGDFASAEAHYQDALRRYEALSDRHGTAHTRAFMGMVSSERGRYTEAQAHLEASLAAYATMGTHVALVPRLAMMILNLRRGGDRAARQQLEAAQAIIGRSGARLYLGAILQGLLVSAADAEDWPAWDRYEARYRKWFDTHGVIDVETAALAVEAVRATARNRQPLRAKRAREHALAQYAAVGQEGRVPALEVP